MVEKTAIVIPALNEEKTLPQLLSRLVEYRNEVIIIDDGSKDQTYEIAVNMNYCVLKNAANRGVSYSIQKGLRYALELGYTRAILLDADGQHDVKYIDSFNEMLMDYDFVMGNRFYLGSIAPDLKWNSNTLGAKIVNRIFGSNFADISCGYKGLHITPPLLKSLEVSNDFSIVFDLLFNELKAKRTIGIINMPAFYTADKLLVTRDSELNSFLFSLCQLDYPIPSEIRDSIAVLSNALKTKCDFYLRLDNIDFYGYYIDRAEGYIIQSSRECQMLL